MFLSRKRTIGLAALLGVGAHYAFAAPVGAIPLKAAKPIRIAGGPGGFDWMTVDEHSHRVYATHKGTKSVAVVDLKTETPLPSVKVGTAQGVAIDRRDNRIFFGDEEEQKVVVVESTTLKRIGEIAVSGPVDDVLYCPQNGMVYADHDDGEEVWVINAKAAKLVGAVTIPSAPEKIEYDATSRRIYQNIKSNNTVQVIDPVTNKVVKSFSTLPATGPHGLAIDGKTQRLFSAGNNGKLVVIDLKSGKVLSSVDIQKGVDQIAFDGGNRRLYCACRGAISVVQETATGAKPLGNIPSPKGSHTIAVDSRTHNVWTCYSDGQESYVLKYAAR